MRQLIENGDFFELDAPLIFLISVVLSGAIARPPYFVLILNLNRYLELSVH
jgi:hypothetical protein